jgi:hypothetical protein
MPEELYVWVVFSVVEVLPSPKLQLHELGLYELVSLNCTVRGAVPFVTLAVKLATGDGWFTFIEKRSYTQYWAVVSVGMTFLSDPSGGQLMAIIQSGSDLIFEIG